MRGAAGRGKFLTFTDTATFLYNNTNKEGAIAMTKAVFFDLYQTLVRYEPPREEIEAKVLRNFGIETSPEALVKPIIAADEFIYNEIARQPLSTRSQEEKIALYAQYQVILLREAGLKYDQKVIPSLLAAMQKSPMELVLFNDVAPALDDLKERVLTLGLISNVEQDMAQTLTKLGLTAWLKIIVTSQDAGTGKPRPEIFRLALKQSGIKPEEAIYVGDQYNVDVVGARGVGMQGILIDRGDYYRDITDCPRIKSLKEVAGYL
jgi:putative hydrolase of the HAD superfamily